MRFIIHPTKIKELIELLKIMKNLTDLVTFVCNPSEINIQVVDDLKLCIFEISIPCNWFKLYKCDNDTMFSVNNKSLCKIFISYVKGYSVECFTENNLFYINYINPENKKEFSLNIIDVDQPILYPIYDDTKLDFSLNINIFDTYLKELSIFGKDIEITCKNDLIHLGSSGETGNTIIEIPNETLIEFNVVDDYDFKRVFNCKHIKCITKLKFIYKKIHLYLDENTPLMITFDDADIKIKYYVSPNIE